MQKELLWSFLFRVVQTLILVAVITNTLSAQQTSRLTPLKPPVTVNIGTDRSSSDAGFFVGVAKGYFQEVGINRSEQY